MAAKQDHDKPMATSATAELVKMKVPKSIQMKAFAIAGSPKGTPDAIVYDKQSQKRARQPSGSIKSDPDQASLESGKRGSVKAGLPGLKGAGGCDHV